MEIVDSWGPGPGLPCVTLPKQEKPLLSIVHLLRGLVVCVPVKPASRALYLPCHPKASRLTFGEQHLGPFSGPKLAIVGPAFSRSCGLNGPKSAQKPAAMHEEGVNGAKGAINQFCPKPELPRIRYPSRSYEGSRAIEQPLFCKA